MHEKRYRIATKPDHPKADGKPDAVVDGLVSESGVFGIHKERVEIDPPVMVDGKAVETVFAVDHLRTGNRIEVFLKEHQARRFVEILERESGKWDKGFFGQPASEVWGEHARAALLTEVLLAQEQADPL